MFYLSLSISDSRSSKLVPPPLFPPAVHLILSPDSGEQHGVRHHITSEPYIVSVHPTGQKFSCGKIYPLVPEYRSSEISGVPISWCQGCEV